METAFHVFFQDGCLAVSCVSDFTGRVAVSNNNLSACVGRVAEDSRVRSNT